MATVHILDTSALGRAFGDETSDEWLRDLLESGAALMSVLGLTEARGIVQTRVRRGLPADAAQALWLQLQAALEHINFTDLDRTDFEAAQALVGAENELRAADAIHLVAARRVADAGVGVAFVTADRRQAAVAERLLDGVRLLP
ncbi:MAG TPA: type II toxin-antitoxin system VapC family toxin [Candidatus Dormibacteraeota bacterium]|nr:type II toxin-antitoxin system VapC family toxin [Candidatus Dormibacteraeota bacterium]